MQPVFRFAPSPTGYLHLGHALSALTDFEVCREMGGRFLLRIEDTDATRCRPEYEQAIYEDLAWLGLTWEVPVRRQSDHLDDYRAAIDQLTAMGLTYPSFMSRQEIATATDMPGWPHDPDGSPLYPSTERDLSADEMAAKLRAGIPRATRLRMDDAAARAGSLAWTETGNGAARMVRAEPRLWGDVVIARKETPTSYHLSVVVDDALQGVTHVVRGEDLFHATAVHVLLQTLLDLPTPVYHHHRLVTGTDGRKLSKADGAVALRTLRAEGKTPADIRALAGLAARI